MMRLLFPLAVCVLLFGCVVLGAEADAAAEAGAVVHRHGRAERLQTNLKPVSSHLTIPLAGTDVFCLSAEGGTGNGGVLGSFSSGQLNIQVTAGCSDPLLIPNKCKVRVTIRVKGKFKFTTLLLDGDAGTIKSKGTQKLSWQDKGNGNTAVKFSFVDDVVITDLDTGDIFPGHFGMECSGPDIPGLSCSFDAPLALDCASLGA
jgi:hypothetical protein